MAGSLGGLLGGIGQEIKGAAAQAMVAVGFDGSAVSHGLAKTTGEFEAAGRSWGSALKIASVGLAAAGAAVVGFMIEGAKAADELNKKIAVMATMVGLTKAQAADLRAGLLDMSTQVPQSIGQLTDSISSILKVGFSVSDSLKIQAQSAKAAAATQSDLNSVTNTTVTTLKAWGMGADQVAKVTDQLTTVIGHSRTDWEALNKAQATAAPIAIAAGMSFEQVNAAIGAVGQSGLPARRAIAGLLALITSLADPTAAARKEAGLLGISFDQTTLKTLGLQGTLDMLTKASGRHVEIVVKQKNGQVDQLKSIAATDKANLGSLGILKTLTGGSAAYLASQILSRDNGKAMTVILDQLNKSAGHTADAFNQVKQADLGMQFKILKNEVQAAAIELGGNLLPYVGAFLEALTTGLPAAFADLSAVWKTTLAPALTALMTVLGQVVKTTGDILFGWQNAGANGGDSFKSAITIIASVASEAAKALTDILTAMEALFSNPVVQGITRVVLILGGLRLAISGVMAMAAGMQGMMMKGLSAMTFGLVKGPTGAVAAADAGAAATKVAAGATEEAATHLSAAGVELSEAATALVEAAALQTSAAERMALSPGQMGMGFVGGAKPVFGAAMTAEEQAAATMAGQKLAAGSEKAIVQNAATSLERTAPTMMSRASGVFTAGAGLLVKGLVVGMIASIGSEILKAPVSDLVTQNTSFKYTGAKIANDFFGGMANLVSSAFLGYDVNAPTMNIGKNSINIAALGASNAQVAANAGTGMAASAYQMGGQATPDLAALTTSTNQLTGALHDQQAFVAKMSPAELVAAAAKAGLATPQATGSTTPPNIGGTQILLPGAGKGGPVLTYDPAALKALAADLATTLAGQNAAGATDRVVAQLQLLGPELSKAQIQSIGNAKLIMLADLMHQLVDTTNLQGTDLLSAQAKNAEIASATQALLHQDLSDLKKPVPAKLSPKEEAARVAAIKATQGPSEARVDIMQARGAAVKLTPQQKVKLATTAELDAYRTAKAELAAKEAAINLNTDTVSAADGAAAFVKAHGAAYKKALAATGDTQIALQQQLMKDTGLATWGALQDAMTNQTAISGITEKALVAKLEPAYKNGLLQATRAGVKGTGNEFFDAWASSVQGADTSKAQAALLAKVNSALPKAEQFKTWDAFSKWFATQFTVSPGKIADDLAVGVRGGLDQLSGKIADDLYQGGANIDAQLGAGIKSPGAVLALKDAMATAVGSAVRDQVPKSPVKEGPLKHPFLFDAGRRILGQIGEGFMGGADAFAGSFGAAISSIAAGGGLGSPQMPSYNLVGAAGAQLQLPPPAPMPAATPGAMAGGEGKAPFHQQLFVGNLQLTGQADEQSIMAQMAAFAPSGR